MVKKSTAVLLAMMMAVTMIFSACSQSEMFENEVDENESARLNAIETSYTIEELSEEYAGVVYTFPRVEGMTNKSKQADVNGHMKRAALKTTTANNGERGVVSDSYEVLLSNDFVFSVRFVTTLDVDIPTRAVTLLVRDHKFIFTLENIFGRAEDNPAFAEMRTVMEDYGVDSSFTDDDFRKLTTYFSGEDMQNLTLHATYFTDQGYDIEVPFADVIDFVADDKYDLFEFAR